MKATINSATAEEKPIEPTDLNERTERALCEYLTVLEDVGRARGAEDLYVVSQSGSGYLVNVREGACECPDHEYRGAYCKHARRVAFATGAEATPAGVDGVDDQLGAHVSATPRVAAADGGAVVKEQDTDDSAESDAEERPEDCDCWNADGPLPCWPCYRDGFTAPNSAELGASGEGEDTDADSEEGAV